MLGHTIILKLVGVIAPTDRPGSFRAVVKLAGGDTFFADGRTKSSAILAVREKVKKSFGAWHTILE